VIVIAAVAAAAAPSGVLHATASKLRSRWRAPITRRISAPEDSLPGLTFGEPTKASLVASAPSRDASQPAAIHSQRGWPERASCEAGCERSNTTHLSPLRFTRSEAGQSEQVAKQVASAPIQYAFEKIARRAVGLPVKMHVPGSSAPSSGMQRHVTANFALSSSSTFRSGA